MNNYYQIYIEQTLQLASTIVIKSTDSADSINNYVTAINGANAVDAVRPETWKYYLNLAGQYHFTDSLMKVISLDTLEEIVFSKENLVFHKATARGYAYGTRQYRQLVSQYPEQEMLILGILYPVDINIAIAAKDGAILGHPPNLVEDNEYSLISNLQTWINGYKARWFDPTNGNPNFSLSDDLYVAASLGIMYLNLVPAILNLRLEACRTNQAHSFHIRQYLASHGFLDVYLDTLTKRQALFFYRNIAYIERNVGKQATFEWLVEHIMTERFLPIAEYTMRHDVSNQPVDLYPTPLFKKTQLNFGVQSDTLRPIDLDTLLLKEDRVAKGNEDVRSANKEVIQSLIENSLANVLDTKVLESSVIDRSNSSPYKLADILLNHWIFLGQRGNYTAVVNVENPKTGEHILVTVKDAFVLAWYVLCKSIGTDLEIIPSVIARRVQRFQNNGMTPVTVDDLLSVVDSKIVPRSVAVEALSVQPQIGNIISTEAFYEKCQELYHAAQVQRGLIALQEDMRASGMVHEMMDRIYSDNVIYLAPSGTTFASWFAERNITVDQLNSIELTSLYKDLVAQSTGANLHVGQTLQELQTSMIKMLTQLSSYSVQFVAEVNGANLTETDWPGVRLGDLKYSTDSHVYIPDSGDDFGSIAYLGFHRVEYDLHGDWAEPHVHIPYTQSVQLDTSIDLEFNPIGEIVTYRHLLTRVELSAKQPFEANWRHIPPFFGIDSYLQLPIDQQQMFKDLYSNGYMGIDNIALISLADIIINPVLNDFGPIDYSVSLTREITDRLLGTAYHP